MVKWGTTSSAVQETVLSAGGGLGRRARLRIWCPLRTWGFDSPLAHHLLSGKAGEGPNIYEGLF